MKKLISLLLAVVMVLSLSTVAFAATSPAKQPGGTDAPSNTITHWLRGHTHPGTRIVDPADFNAEEKSKMDEYIEQAQQDGYLVKSWFIVYVGPDDDVVSVGIWKRASDLVFANGSEIIFAGGASKSPLWCQILADVLGLPVKVPVVKEATALGAAILAGYGVGIYDSIEHGAERCVKWDKAFQPNMENHKIYEELYPVWRKVYDAQLALSDAHVTRYMWSAPGV